MLLGKSSKLGMVDLSSRNQKPVAKAPADNIRNRFDFYLSILKGYARYAQKYENKSKAEVTADINKIADQLITQYHFGAKFISELHRYIQQRFIQPSTKVFSEIQEESGLDEETFNKFSRELVRKDSVNVFDSFSPRFRSIFD